MIFQHGIRHKKSFISRKPETIQLFRIYFAFERKLLKFINKSNYRPTAQTHANWQFQYVQAK